MILRREGEPMQVCAWCDVEFGTRPGSLRGVDAANFGMCRRCLSERLVALIGVPSGTQHKPLQPLRRAARAVKRKRKARKRTAAAL